jgi:mevalonate kinase
MITNTQKTFFSNGKLLLSGEYAVLDGATAFAIPVNMGQTLEIYDYIKTNVLRWEAYVNDTLWFFAEIDTDSLTILNTNIKSVAELLKKIILAGIELNNKFKNKLKSKIITNLNFNRNWGLGSSSTLISNIAYWADIDPFKLFNSVFDGSGYDIAAARIPKPFLYTPIQGDKPIIEEINFEKDFLDSIYFVYLGKKQNSIKSVDNYRKLSKLSNNQILEISNISKSFSKCKTLESFQELMINHENIISKIIKTPPIKKEYFNDFEGRIKSLGAWGGDFIMIASNKGKNYVNSYFKNKKLDTIFSYKELIIK